MIFFIKSPYAHWRSRARHLLSVIVQQAFKNKIIMRLNIIILTVILACLNLKAEISSAQTISLTVKDKPITTVFNQIRQQTGYMFFYKNSQLKDAANVTLEIKNTPLKEALDRVMDNQPFTYEILDKTIVIKEKEKATRIQQGIDVQGTVLHANGEPLIGATIRTQSGSAITQSNNRGQFTLKNVTEGETLFIAYLGHTTAEVAAKPNIGTVRLQPTTDELEAVNVSVSTGYQSLPKERATGSFTQVDSSLLSRTPSTNIIDRLNGVANGLLIHSGRSYNSTGISIRGRSSILGNTNPLIVVDNFPYGGDLSAINPNDVETVTLLKDAAAASIWGTQAGNGVIVITTKSGKYNQKATINLTSNVTIGQKPRLFTQRQMSSAEYIEVETKMFEIGRYNSAINNGYAALSPAVEILLQHRNNKINLDRRNAMLDSLAQYDTRHDRLKYLYRVPINQQYNLSISGGTTVQKYYLSAGYDKNLLTEVGNSFERFSLNGQNTFNLLNDRLQLVSGMQFTGNQNDASKGANAAAYKWPYLRLADDAGNALPVANDLRFSYIEAQNGKGLLDWYYRPLDELEPSSFTNGLNFRLQNTLSYRIIPQLSITAFHTYQKGVSNTDNYNYANSYFTRNMINSITSINNTTGVVTRPIAEGDILNNSRSTLTGQYGRLQAAFDQTFAQRHSINAIAGAEISEFKSDNAAYTLYGYNPETGANANAAINYTQSYTKYTAGTFIVPNGISNGGLVDHNVSYYANGAYTYDNRYTLSASARKDQSNIFGVKSNQKGVPLWSVGGLWHIGRESFYQVDWLPTLALRSTYGYNGNVDKATSAYFTMQLIGFANDYGFPQYYINTPPNPSLRWEKVSNLNFAIEFATAKNRLSGSIEYYQKNGKDLIGLSPLATQTGANSYRGNNANLQTHGLDVRLTSQNLTGSGLQWQTTFLLNYVKDKVTAYMAKPGSNNDIVGNNANQTPLEGYPYSAWFAYRWAGLDDTGAPQSYLNGEVSKDYGAMVSSTNRDDILYMGSRVPTLFGSLLNTFTYKNWQLSCLLTYKTGYVFKNSNSLSNSNLYATSNVSYTLSPDYANRWQNPGDELYTDVPALIYPTNTNRDVIYTNSELHIYKGDHFRLQDARLSYSLQKSALNKLPFKQLSLFAYGSNLGILWQANKAGFDPDGLAIQQTRSLAFGLNAQF
ncbi:SusC/RagA family TonB-linked outer membrane protein [Sphingobacterium sp. PCS056]|uniref:SusC/RagA family TonB-linked outer membrane protein n=1 Tax=Sphingobacterium sp. PCS056 TaxID=2931400 RepID=UPI00201085DB|nr:SusC/RagA family TonB-linked outer membrane protein [Sphingobacterium sp. PCS056]UPZ37986.1 SusC/RagA family TonB-linked outer membrane protein [Sphingobacterium sp. PCS056]